MRAKSARRASRPRRAGAEAEAASRTKSAFLANMSHELRTPLNAIIGYSEILVEDATDRGDKTSIADLEKIQSAGKHLLGLINDILDLSKIEAGRMDVYLEQVFLSRLVDEVKTIVDPMIEKNDNRLVIDCPVDIGSLRTDLTKLKQSLINLLSNAAKFTKQGDVTLKIWRDTGAGRPALGQDRGLRQRHRHDRGADRQAVSGLHPGRFLDHAQLRRHRPRPDHHQAFLHHAGRHDRRHQHAGQGLDLHDQPAGSAVQAGAPTGR